MLEHDEPYVYVSDGKEFGRFPKRYLKLCKNPDTATVRELRQIQQMEEEGALAGTSETLLPVSH